MGVLKSLSSVLAFVSKELAEAVRRPGALLSLVAGPFLVMLLFGLGFSGFAPPKQAVLVIPDGVGLPTDAAAYADIASGIVVVEVVADAQEAEARLSRGEIDLVVQAPGDLAEAVSAGNRPTLVFTVHLTDPVAEANAKYLAALFSAEVNRRIILEAVRAGQESAFGQGGELGAIPAEAIAAPTRTELVNLAPVAPSLVAFYGTAMLAFVIQHLSVSLMGLSLVRERTTGSFERFRVSPVGASEVILGKVVAFGLLAALAATTLTLLLVFGMGVPLLGSPRDLVLALVLVSLASLGLGVVVGMVSDSERQVVQLALLILLASIFFTGFVLTVDLFRPEIQPLMYLLPATHGIALTRDLMLQGWTNDPWHFAALTVIALALLVVGWQLLRRRMADS
ncbi:MAG TPA: ABC transporter permease [Candidatus Limnocylindria bacterium]|nr:ABC transporter permease [Candidatus Limnocylindria bacterium]